MKFIEKLIIIAAIILVCIWAVAIYPFIHELHMAWFKNEQKAIFWTNFWYILYICYSITKILSIYYNPRIPKSKIESIKMKLLNNYLSKKNGEDSMDASEYYNLINKEVHSAFHNLILSLLPYVVLIIATIAAYPYFLDLLSIWLGSESAVFWVNFWYLVIIIPGFILGIAFTRVEKSVD